MYGATPHDEVLCWLNPHAFLLWAAGALMLLLVVLLVQVVRHALARWCYRGCCADTISSRLLLCISPPVACSADPPRFS